MIKISPFTPLFFNPSSDEYGVESRYMQVFSLTDTIVIEVFTTEAEFVSGKIVNAVSDTEAAIVFREKKLSDTVSVYLARIVGLVEGYYYAEICGKRSEIFRSTASESELAGTTLIQYTSSSNRTRTDVLFHDGNEQIEFSFRVHGGFKDDDWGFAVNNEQFEIGDGNIVELFAVESTQKSFTMGNAMGCPIWFGEHLNRILCCSKVHFNGTRYVRKGNSVPEVIKEGDGHKSYKFRVQLQGMVENIDVELPSSEGGEPSGGGEGYVYLVKLNDATRPTDANTFSSLRTLFEINKAVKNEVGTLDAKFLSKTKPDTAQDLITFMKGLFSRDDVIIGENGFAGGLMGFGAKIDKSGRGEMRSLRLWEFLEVPELRYNSVSVHVGIDWKVAGAGIVEEVFIDRDENGNPLNSGIVKLKLEDGQCGTIDVDDGAIGIWHFGQGDATADSDDGKGNFQFAGFTTTYFRITEIRGANKSSFKYFLRDGFTAHPQPQMTFACYMNFTKKERQRCYYSTRAYQRLLVGMNTWEISRANIGAQFGDLESYPLPTNFKQSIDGYAAVVDSILFTGSITQIKKDGTEIKQPNFIKDEWFQGFVAKYYDCVPCDGSLWLCVSEKGTSTRPSRSDSAWLEYVKAGTGIQPYNSWHSGKEYPTGSMINFFEQIVVSKTYTRNPPMPLLTDKDGFYITDKNGNYLIAENRLNPEWGLLLDASGLTNGEDGQSIEVRYSADEVNWHFPYAEGDKFMQQRLGDGAWSDSMPFIGENGLPGADGGYRSFEFAKNDKIDVAPLTGWQDEPPIVGVGEYLWMRTGWVTPPATSPVSWSDPIRQKGDKGDKGDSYSHRGDWKTEKMPAAKMDVFTMAGKMFVAKQETSLPPLHTLTDKDGNRLMDKDGHYLLTGEINETDYDLLIESGKDGSDGTDYEWIFYQSEIEKKPQRPDSEQTDDYVPTGWTDDSFGVTKERPYEFACVRTKTDGVWSVYSEPSLWHRYSKDGVNSIYADLDNEMDSIALTYEGNAEENTTLSTVVSMWDGQRRVEIESISTDAQEPFNVVTDVISGKVAISVAKGVKVPDRTEIRISVTANINGVDETRTMSFTLAGVKRGADGQSAVLYRLQVSTNSVIKDKDGSMSATTVSACRTEQKDGVTTESLAGKLTYTIDEATTPIEVKNNKAVDISAMKSRITFSFHDSLGRLVDRESIPLIKDGKDGKNSITVDLSNEMDSVALSSAGKVEQATTLSTIVTMWDGQHPVSIETLTTNATAPVIATTEASTGKITFSIAGGSSLNDRTEIVISATASINGQNETRTLAFTIVGVRKGADGLSPILYRLTTSAGSVTRDKEGNLSVTSLSACRTAQIDGETIPSTAGRLTYLIDDQPGEGTEIANSTPVDIANMKSKVIFSFYDDNGALVDRETVPLLKDGADGRDGKDAVTVDLSNEMDSVDLYSSGYSVQSVQLSTVISVWYGETKVALTKLTTNAASPIVATCTKETGKIIFEIPVGSSLPSRTEITISIEAVAGGNKIARSAVFVIAGIRRGMDAEAPSIYSLQLSASSIVQKKDGSYEPASVNAVRKEMKGGLIYDASTKGHLRYQIDGQQEHDIADGVDVQDIQTMVSKVRFTFYDEDGTTILDRETIPLISDGKDGDGFTPMGNFKSGMYIPKNGIVTMRGSVWRAKVGTENPPLCTLTDKDGNRLQDQDGNYLLTGEENTDEYELFVPAAEDGKDGKDGQNGLDGADGKDGAKGDKGDKGNPFTYNDFTEQQLNDLRGKDGKQGIQGCVTRTSKWNANTDYHNDADLKTDGIRYLDVVLIPSDITESGWQAYSCKENHRSGTQMDMTKWQPFDENIDRIYTNLIIAKDAQITFFSGNQILITNSLNQVTAGLSGHEDAEGHGTRFWAGAVNPSDAPFQVDDLGHVKATDAEIAGRITSSEGSIGGFELGSERIGFKRIEEDGHYINNGMSLTSDSIVFSNTHFNAVKFGFFDDPEAGALIIDSGKKRAMNIVTGCISNLNVETLILDNNSHNISIPFSVYSVIARHTSAFRIELPVMDAGSDGHVVEVVNAYAGPVSHSSHNHPDIRLTVEAPKTLVNGVFIPDNYIYKGKYGISGEDNLLDVGDSCRYIYHHNLVIDGHKGIWVRCILQKES